MSSLSAPLIRHSFRCMGSSITFIVDAPETPVVREALIDAEAEMHRLAQMMSRFDERSELCHLNTARSLACSPELFTVIALAVQAHQHTEGRFNPTLYDAMISAGYDRTFDELDAAAGTHERSTSSTPQRAQRRSTTALPLQLDHGTHCVTLLDDARLDLGGIAKGWIADQVCAQLACTAPSLVNAGGDIACSARAHGEPWLVEVAPSAGSEPSADETPALQQAPPLTLAFAEGGIATSGTDRRRWHLPNTAQVQHHIMDPQTSLPATTDLSRVTVIAGTCAEAEILATSLLLQGYAAAKHAASEDQIPAVLTRPGARFELAGPLAAS